MDGLKPSKPTSQPPSQPRANRPKQPKNKAGLKSKLHRLKHRPLMLLIAIGLVAFGIALFAWYSLPSDETVRPERLTPLEQAADHYDPLAPDTADTSDIDFHFDPDRMVFSFNDVHNDVPLIISQQPAPENIQSDPEELVDIARHMQAENSIETDKGTVYITSEQSSSNQTAIFTADGILVFIHSSRTLTFEEWQGYINTLSHQ